MSLDFTSRPLLRSLPRLFALVAFSTGLAATHAQGGTDAPATAPAPAALAHVALRTTDIERTLVFYRDYLGLTERFRTDQVPGKPNVYYKRGQPPVPREGRLLLVDLRIGEQHTLELFAGRESGQTVLHHVALRMSDLGAARDALERQGAKVPPVPATKAFFVTNPSGQTLELLAPAPQANPRASSGPKSSLRDIEYVVLPIQEPDASAAFYHQTLSLGEEFVAVGANGKTTAPGGREARQLLLSTTETEPLVCLGVLDLETFHARLQSEAPGLGFTPPPRLGSDLQGDRFFELLDPDGFRLRFVELSGSQPGQAGQTSAGL